MKTFLQVVAFFGLALLLTQNALGKELVIDTLEDFENATSLSATCKNGYQANSSDFKCGGGLFPIHVNIPEEDLNGEEGFWTGCANECDLKYSMIGRANTTFRFRAYFKDMHMTIRKNGVVSEEVSGTNWTVVDVDTDFTYTIDLQFHAVTRNAFVALDKIFISSDD